MDVKRREEGKGWMIFIFFSLQARCYCATVVQSDIVNIMQKSPDPWSMLYKNKLVTENQVFLICQNGKSKKERDTGA